MKVIILAAGQGSRLRPLTDNRPKSMVELASKPLILHQLKAMHDVGLRHENIAIVTGYCRKHQEKLGYKTFENKEFMNTNMVYSLFCASEWMDENQDLLIAYGDIVYHKSVLEKLINTQGETVLAADLLWQKLWTARAEDFLADAETFRVNDDGFVSEVGKRPLSLEDIDAQYMGLVKVRSDKVAAFKEAYTTLIAKAHNAGNNSNNMYMTDFINDLIGTGWQITPAFVEGLWLEIDTVSDLQLYSSMLDPTNPHNLSSVYQKILAGSDL
jgi:L-glutamine-phosphate cytidylyltransferase